MHTDCDLNSAITAMRKREKARAAAETKEKTMFNEYGNIPEIPQDIMEAQNAYMRVLKPHLDKMTIIEAKAFIWNIGMDGHFAVYILTRQVNLRKSKREGKKNA